MLSIKGIGQFIRNVYKKHYLKFKFMPHPQLLEATYAPDKKYTLMTYFMTGHSDKSKTNACDN